MWDRVQAPAQGKLTDDHGEYSIPDLALLLPKDPVLRAKIAELPAIEISSFASSLDESFTYLGNGPAAMNGLLQFGNIKFSEIGEIYSTATSNNKNAVSALEPGDSGGALFRENMDGKYELVGIGFERIIKKKETISLVTKLQNPYIMEWLISNYENLTSISLQWSKVPPKSGKNNSTINN